MKNLKQNLLIVMAMVLIGSFGAYAQEGTMDSQSKKIEADKAAKEKVVKDKKVDYADQVKEKAQKKKGDLSEEKAKKAKDLKDRKDKIGQDKDGQQDELDEVVKGYNKLKTEWKERIKEAPESEKAALEKQMMEDLTKYREGIKKKRGDATDGASSVYAKKDDADVSADGKTDRGIAVVDKDDADNEGPISAGEAKIDAATKKIDAKVNMINQKRKLIAKAETKVADSKARLAVAKEKGNLTEAEVTAKEAQIARAESLISKLEASLSNGTNVLNAQKAKLTPSVNKN